MQKKYLVFLTVIISLATFLGSWHYQANAFEQEVKNNYLKFFGQYKSYLSYEAVEIDKYRFKVMVHKLKLFSQLKTLSFASDKLLITAHPFNHRIYLDSIGGHESPSLTTTILFAPQHHITISINKAFFKKFADLKLTAKVANLKLLDVRTEREVLNCDNYKLTITHQQQDKKNYSLKLKSQGQGIKLGGLFRQFLISEILIPQLKLPTVNMQYKEDYFRLLSAIARLHNAATVNTKLHLVYQQDLLASILKALTTTDNVSPLLLVAKFLGKNISIDMHSTATDQVVSSEFDLQFSNNNKLTLTSNSSYNYSNEQKRQLIDWLSDYLQKIVNRDFNKLLRANLEPVVFSHQDFRDMVLPLVNINNLNFKLHIDYPHSDDTITYLTACAVDNVTLQYLGAYHNHLHDASLSVTRPLQLLDDIVFFSEHALYAFLEKLPDSKFAQRLTALTMALKQFGPGALEALNNTGPLTNNTPLVVSISADARTADIKINNRRVEEVLKNAKIQALLHSLIEEQASNSF